MKKFLTVLTFLLLGLISASAKTAYVAIDPSTKVMTFRYDDSRSVLQRLGNTIYTLNADGEAPGWNSDSNKDKITKVVFDTSFADARPTTTYCWFRWMEALERIEGIKNLNTSQVTDMSYMFCGCYKLSGLDVSGFNTSAVTTMKCMFYQCRGLTALDLSGFNTSRVTDMNNMFSGCEGLTSLDVTASTHRM